MKITETDLEPLVVEEEKWIVPPGYVRHLNELKVTPKSDEVARVRMVSRKGLENVTRKLGDAVNLKHRSLRDALLIEIGSNRYYREFKARGIVPEVYSVLAIELSEHAEGILEGDRNRKILKEEDIKGTHNPLKYIPVSLYDKADNESKRLGIPMTLILYIWENMGILEIKDRIPIGKKECLVSEMTVEQFWDELWMHSRNIARRAKYAMEVYKESISEEVYNRAVEVIRRQMESVPWSISKKQEDSTATNNDNIALILGEDLYELLLSKYGSKYKATRRLQKAAEEQMRKEGRIPDEVKEVRVRPSFIKENMVFDLEIVCKYLEIDLELLPDNIISECRMARHVKYKGGWFALWYNASEIVKPGCGNQILKEILKQNSLKKYKNRTIEQGVP